MDFILTNKDIIHSIGHTTFLLGKCSKVMRDPDVFGVSDICTDSHATLGLWVSYSVSRGLTQAQAQNLAKEFLQKLKKEYSDFCIWGTLFREHLLLYLAHYKTRKLSSLFGKPCRPAHEAQAKPSFQLNETCIPQLKSGVFCGKTKFDVAKILGEKSQEEKPLCPSQVVVLWDSEGGSVFSITPSAAAILSYCDGQRTLARIVNRIAEDYDVSAQKVVADCKEFIDTMVKVGLCTVIT